MKTEEIGEKLQEAGGTLYRVGGCLRDRVLGISVHDEDFCVTGITPEKFEAIFPQAIIRGKSFAVYDLEGKEIALARKERKMKEGHKGFYIETSPNITIEEDLARRDITINAMAEDVLTKAWIDPFGGREDLQNKTIKAVSNAFCEDPLRVYRVARFAAMLEFKVDDDTILLMKKLKQELYTLSAERVFHELKKALSTNKPSIFFRVLQNADVLDIHFKEIKNLIGSIQPKEYHPEGDSFEHTMQVVDKSTLLTKDLKIRFSCLVHDLGKGVTPKEMQPHHYGHDEKGVMLVENLGKRLKIPKLWVKCGKTAAKEHMKGGIFSQMTLAKQVDYITRVSKSSLGLDGMKIVVMADKARGDKDFPTEIFFENLGTEMLHAVTGEKIKQKYRITVKDGKKVAELLRTERIAWLKEKNNKESIEN